MVYVMEISENIFFGKCQLTFHTFENIYQHPAFEQRLQSQKIGFVLMSRECLGRLR